MLPLWGNQREPYWIRGYNFSETPGHTRRKLNVSKKLWLFEWEMVNISWTLALDRHILKARSSSHRSQVWWLDPSTLGGFLKIWGTANHWVFALVTTNFAWFRGPFFWKPRYLARRRILVKSTNNGFNNENRKCRDFSPMVPTATKTRKYDNFQWFPEIGAPPNHQFKIIWMGFSMK